MPHEDCQAHQIDILSNASSVDGVADGRDELEHVI